ncbi:hypothetical protein [Paraburkholderia tuberum]|uniref:hypothetical protein n=1 Tax=Paraburkholderia tuberum TaxID=157910 RepID=UPI00115F7E8A|nr:hypothetical protein [Paraburkholderia tuberum]
MKTAERNIVATDERQIHSFNERYGGASKRLRRTGIVALARRLAVALWLYLASPITRLADTLFNLASAAGVLRRKRSAMQDQIARHISAVIVFEIDPVAAEAVLAEMLELSHEHVFVGRTVAVEIVGRAVRRESSA